MAYGRYGSYGFGAGNGSCLGASAPIRAVIQPMAGYKSEAAQRVNSREYYRGESYGNAYGAGEVQAISAGVQSIFAFAGKAADAKLICETIRISTFHMASLRKNTSYKQFCRSFPLWFDKETRVQTIPKETAEKIEREIYNIVDQINKKKK